MGRLTAPPPDAKDTHAIQYTVVSGFAVLLLTTAAAAQEGPRAAVIWYDRGDASAMNLLTGPGGPEREPGTDFRFVKESVSGTSPKFEVEDENGVTWKVKVGEEGPGETAAARLLWAAGYVVDEDYYRAQIHVRGMKTLTRGQQFVSADGVVTGVRLERDVPNADTNPWSWYDNPLRRHARVQRPPGDDGARQQLGPQGHQQRRRRDG